MNKKEIPVYLFTGFLDSGKTKFIQSTLEDPRFNSGERTLLLMCEDGEEEYDLSAFSGDNVYLRRIEDVEELNEVNLIKLAAETRCERVVIEYNGMWTGSQLWDALPEGWLIAQEVTFAEATTYTVYNQNMRNLVYDKLLTAEVVFFNRCEEATDKEALHKIVRQVNRRSQIFYEFVGGRTLMDETEDPLPFDKNAALIDVEDRDFAYFFSDLMENSKDYEGKSVRFTALNPEDKRLPNNAFVAGRQLMNCCAADARFAGLVCYPGDLAKPAKGSWVHLTGKIALRKNHIYSGKVPVLNLTAIEPATEPEQAVATFY